MTMKLSDIDKKAKYEGYIWMSDATQPTVLNKEPISIDLADGTNPFVIEAELFDAEKSVSYSVRFVDGQTKVRKFEVDELKLFGEQTLSYVSHRIGDGIKLKFYRKWKKELDPDNLCEGMETLVPSDFVFIGFETINKEEE